MSTLCNNYINRSSYVYTLAGSDQFKVSRKVDLLEIIVSGEDSHECQDLVSRIVCNYYFAPCGNSINGVHLPLSLCREECEYVREKCFNLWMQVHQATAELDSEIINCYDTTIRFQGMSTCCSNFGITIIHDGKPEQAHTCSVSIAVSFIQGFEEGSSSNTNFPAYPF